MKTDHLIIDGRHLLFRCSDAFRELSAEVKGETVGTGGVYGFLAAARRVHARYGGKVRVAWEGKGNFRLKLYPHYKKKDETDPERDRIRSEMTRQQKVLEKLLHVLGVDQHWGVGCEADDVIGRLTHTSEGTVVIYTGDSDLRQLIDPDGRVTVVSPGFKTDKAYNWEEVRAKHGVTPNLLAQLKAIAGDNSDAIPGAPGIGDKTAAALLNHYGSLQAVLKAAEAEDALWPETPRRCRLIKEAAADIRMYYQLTRVRRTLPCRVLRGARDQRAVLEQFKELKFRSLSFPAELSALMAMGGGEK